MDRNFSENRAIPPPDDRKGRHYARLLAYCDISGVVILLAVARFPQPDSLC